MSSAPLKKTALHQEHLALGARMAPFANYDMPIQYSGVIDEHQAVRQNAGLFDVSHMGFATVEGPDAKKFLDSVFTRDFSKVFPNQAAYTLLLQQDGGCVDDLIVYCEYLDRFSMILNASNKDQDIAHLRSHKGSFNVDIGDPRDDISILALQGPKTPDILKAIGFTAAWPKAFHHGEYFLTNNIPAKIAFTGYTGELGCEIVLRNQFAQNLWKTLLKAGQPFGLKPCGLGARDTLRLEMGYSLYGHELGPDINPLEAGLKWAVDLENRNFVGAQALRDFQKNPKRKLVSLQDSGRKAPRQGMRVTDGSGQDVGFITSGSFSPTLNHVIGLALVNFNSQAPYQVVIRNESVPFQVSKRPFYKVQQKQINE